MRLRYLATVSSLILLAGAQGAAAETPSGIVEGTLSFPSDSLPGDLTVCAVDHRRGGETCTKKKVKLKGGRYGYRLQLAPGIYQIYARTAEMAGVKAYYSKFVVCGLDASCPSHDPVDVEVKAGSRLGKIDPGDWYAR